VDATDREARGVEGLLCGIAQRPSLGVAADLTACFCRYGMHEAEANRVFAARCPLVPACLLMRRPRQHQCGFTCDLDSKRADSILSIGMPARASWEGLRVRVKDVGPFGCAFCQHRV
jgi:hypothetical protein